MNSVFSKTLFISIALSLNPSQPIAPIKIAQVLEASKFSIYCTSNQDGTGACNRTDNNQPIACLIIPGGVINCKEKGEMAIQCVLYSSTLNSQAYFYCTRRTDPGIRSNRLKDDRFSTAAPPATNIVDPINDTSDPIQNPFNDPFNEWQQ